MLTTIVVLIAKLYTGDVAVDQIVERNRVSKLLEGYIQSTQNMAALKRTHDQNLDVHPVQGIQYVVVDNEKSSRERIVLIYKDVETYDLAYYETQIVRVVESFLSLFW